jgi:hypothetical protein
MVFDNVAFLEFQGGGYLGVMGGKQIGGLGQVHRQRAVLPI